MELVTKIISEKKDVIKYVFRRDDKKILEFSYINKNDGKDIICVPSQTMCYLKCKFCHTTEYVGKIGVENVLHWQYMHAIEYITNEIDWKNRNTKLLISFMGCGEPISNPHNVLFTAEKLREKYENVRFALATILPKHEMSNFFYLTEKIAEANLNFKFHYSLHFTDNETREDWMPAAIDIDTGIAAFNYYSKRTGNDIEVHYTLIDGVNDTEEDAKELAIMLFQSDFNNVKFLYYNEKNNIDFKRSTEEKVNTFREWLHHAHIKCEYKIPDGQDIGSSCGQFLGKTEYYVPPGLDIGASCGQFNMKEYL